MKNGHFIHEALKYIHSSSAIAYKSQHQHLEGHPIIPYHTMVKKKNYQLSLDVSQRKIECSGVGENKLFAFIRGEIS